MKENKPEDYLCLVTQKVKVHLLTQQLGKIIHLTAG